LDDSIVQAGILIIITIFSVAFSSWVFLEKEMKSKLNQIVKSKLSKR
jgi:hypothetical protein